MVSHGRVYEAWLGPASLVPAHFSLIFQLAHCICDLSPSLSSKFLFCASQPELCLALRPLTKPRAPGQSKNPSLISGSGLPVMTATHSQRLPTLELSQEPDRCTLRVERPCWSSYTHNTYRSATLCTELMENRDRHGEKHSGVAE